MSKLEKATFSINKHLMSHCVTLNVVSSLSIKQDPETSGTLWLEKFKSQTNVIEILEKMDFGFQFCIFR